MVVPYDSDEDTRSPPPERQVIDYGPVAPERPPFLRPDSSSNSDDAKDAAEKGLPLERFCNSRPETTRFGDQALLLSLDPNQGPIAAYERDNPLSKRIQLDDDFDQSTKHESKRPSEQPPRSSAIPEEDMAQKALHLMRDDARPGKDPSTHSKGRDIIIETKLQPSPNPPGKLSIDTTKDVPRDDPRGPVKDIELHHSKPILPAIQPSPQSTATTSPGSRPELPSLQSALAELPGVRPKDPSRNVNGASPYPFLPVPVSSPSVPRSDMAREPHLAQLPPPQIPPSPYSHLSPASSKDMSNISSPVSQQSYWRPLKSDVHFVPSNYEPSPQTAKSPTASYPTPTDQTAGDRASFSSSMQSNGSMSSGIYKCSYPGCTAPPFQTQYLLNSHAKVHSQDRPHFCPVEGCPRSFGGKGFKRKNEMIRHGLVHNSPGYVCPFCPDQEHKYPRPDNLQRHVRVHHVDKNKDDPALRSVLAQRPEGSTRGRRRRTNG